jgi:molybdate transport system substrate-binding protein
MMRNWLAAAAVSIGMATTANAADLKMLAPVAMRGLMADVTAEFEKASGHKVVAEFATAGAVANRLQKGEMADVAISSTSQVDALEAQGKLEKGTRITVARVGIGLFVKTGSPKPKVETVEDFKLVLKSAKSMSYGDPSAGGVSGIHMARLMERLNLTDLQSKTTLLPDSQAVMSAVAKGESEIGFGLTSDAALVAGVELVAALPADIQNFTEYAAAVVVGSKEGASVELVKYLSSPSARAAMKAKGFEPR